MGNKNLIEIRSLHKSFGTHKVLDGLDLNIKKDSSLVVLGASGTGKSILIKTIIGLVQPDSGTIIFDGKKINSISTKERFKVLENCGFLFQSGALFDSLTVQENITFFAEKLYSLKKEEKKELAQKKLKLVGLSDRILNSYPAELSGGMQKRVALARAICTNPKVIFFDEPTGGLDPILSNIISDLIIKAREELGATTITISHDMNSMKRIATEVALLHEGKIKWLGKKEDVEKTDNPYIHQFTNGLAEGPLNV